jgi:hypothetical protein
VLFSFFLVQIPGTPLAFFCVGIRLPRNWQNYAGRASGQDEKVLCGNGGRGRATASRQPVKEERKGGRGGQGKECIISSRAVPIPNPSPLPSASSLAKQLPLPFPSIGGVKGDIGIQQESRANLLPSSPNFFNLIHVFCCSFFLLPIANSNSLLVFSMLFQPQMAAIGQLLSQGSFPWERAGRIGQGVGNSTDCPKLTK